MFDLVSVFRTSSLRDCISSDPERTALRRKGEVPDYIEVLQQRADSLNTNRLLINENQISQVKEFSVFLCTEGCRSGDSLKSFLWYAPQLFAGQYPVLSHPEFPQGSLGVTVVWWLLDVRYSFLPEFPQSSPAHVGWRAAIADDSDILCLLIWQAIFHLSLVLGKGLKHWIDFVLKGVTPETNLQGNENPGFFSSESGSPKGYVSRWSKCIEGISANLSPKEVGWVCR